MTEAINNNISDEYFEFINQECLFYSISLFVDGRVVLNWESLSPNDYDLNADVINKINLRIHKTKNGKFFLDSFQKTRECGMLFWKGFSIGKCVGYHIITNPHNASLFDIVVEFDNGEKLQFIQTTRDIVFNIQEFFSGFM